MSLTREAWCRLSFHLLLSPLVPWCISSCVSSKAKSSVRPQAGHLSAQHSGQSCVFPGASPTPQAKRQCQFPALSSASPDLPAWVAVVTPRMRNRSGETPGGIRKSFLWIHLSWAGRREAFWLCLNHHFTFASSQEFCPKGQRLRELCRFLLPFPVVQPRLSGSPPARNRT